MDAAQDLSGLIPELPAALVVAPSVLDEA